MVNYVSVRELLSSITCYNNLMFCQLVNTVPSIAPKKLERVIAKTTEQFERMGLAVMRGVSKEWCNEDKMPYEYLKSWKQMHHAGDVIENELNLIAAKSPELGETVRRAERVLDAYNMAANRLFATTVTYKTAVLKDVVGAMGELLVIAMPMLVSFFSHDLDFILRRANHLGIVPKKDDVGAKISRIIGPRLKRALCESAMKE